MGLDNVIFIDSVPKAEVVRYWSLLDVSIIHLRKTILFTTVIPSKLFECMGMGIPVLHGVMGESAQIVEKEGVGLLFEPENKDALCQNLLKMKNDPALYQTFKANCLARAPDSICPCIDHIHFSYAAGHKIRREIRGNGYPG